MIDKDLDFLAQTKAEKFVNELLSNEIQRRGAALETPTSTSSMKSRNSLRMFATSLKTSTQKIAAIINPRKSSQDEEVAI
jgi:hypothetical protein